MWNDCVRSIGGVWISAIAASLIAIGHCSAAATVTASSPYLSIANSTLNSLSSTYFVENFEDGNLNLPGVSFSAIAGSGIQAGSSVDADDGTIDGSGTGGMNFQGATSASVQSTTFFFSQVAGQWPRQVAIAVTDGSSFPLSFAAYDTNSNPSGSLTMNVIGQSGTADDFLVTFTDNNGISAIAMTSSNAFTNMHYDHLQFDTAPVPEPTAAVALGIGAGVFLSRRRR
jgi:hypothetical protein